MVKSLLKSTGCIAALLLLCITPAEAQQKDNSIEEQARSYWRSQIRNYSGTKYLSRAVKGGKLHSSKVTIPMGKQIAKSPLRREDEKPVTIYGQLISSDDTGEGAGIYSFTAGEDLTLTPVFVNSNLSGSNGSVYHNGLYEVLNFNHYMQYDAESWELQNEQTTAWSTTSTIQATALAWDKSDDKIYGCFLSYEDWSYHLKTMDYTTLTSTEIAPLSTSGLLRWMVITPDGKMYGMNQDGNLYSIDKATGNQTLIGNAGVTLDGVVQGAACDPATGKIYWASQLTGGTAALYEVDVEDASITMLGEFPNGEELTGMYILAPKAADGAPAACTDLAVNFENGETTGNVSFTMPDKTFGGSDLSGALTYEVKFNDSVVANGTAQAGEKVTTSEISVADGLYTVSVTASNAEGQGDQAKTKKYIGYDEPSPVANLKLASDEKVVSLSWDSVKTSLNNGYLDTANIKYDVVRYPDSLVVANHQSSTKFTETIDDDNLKVYSYGVTAYNGKVAGKETRSDGVRIGSAVVPPYHNDFSDATSLDLFTILDANNDNYTWKWDNWNSDVTVNCYSSADDWLITPPIKLENNKVYKFYFKAAGYNSWYPQTFTCNMGKSATASGLTDELVADTLTSNSFKTYTKDIKVAESGVYYFGIHCTSDGWSTQLSVDSLGIDAGTLLSTPDSVTSFTITAGAAGALEATVSFNAPTQTGDGNPLTDLSSIVVMRNDSIISTIEGAENGMAYTVEDKNVPQGMNNYTVYACSGSNKGISQTKSAWIGLDIPDVVTDIKVSDDVDHYTVSWKAPEKGKHGGYLNQSELTYMIQRLGGVVVASDYANTSIEDTPDMNVEQQTMAYGIVCHNTEGSSDVATSDLFVLGVPYELPYKESFSGGSTSTFWGITDNNASFRLSEDQYADNDGGSVQFIPSTAGGEATLYSGKISLKNSLKPTLQFQYTGDEGVGLTCDVEVQTPNGTITKVGNFEIDNLDSEWPAKEIDLSNFTSERYIQIRFVGKNTEDGYNQFWIDNIRVTDKLNNNLSVEATAPAVLQPGTKDDISAIVNNLGQLKAEGYTVQLYKNNELVEEQEGEAINAGNSARFTFEITANATSEKEAHYYVYVNYPQDENTLNNKSDELTIRIPVSDYPAPTGLTAAFDETASSTQLSWNAPVLDDQPVETVDGVEDYKPFAISEIGNWTVFDGDGSATYGISTGSEGIYQYDNAASPMAFQVFNPKRAGLPVDGNAAAWKPYEGEQMFVAFNDVDGQDDDWLISPELSGKAQTVKFMAKSFNEYYGLEKYEVLYSTTDKDTASFTRVAQGEAPVNWTEITAELPEGAKYFAIRCVSTNSFALMVDDIHYDAQPYSEYKLLGYNVYCNGEKVNESLVTSTTYEDKVELTDASQVLNYQVSAVYDKGEGAACSPVTVTTPTGIDSIVPDANGKYTVYTLDGKCVLYRGNDIKHIPAGVYIINNRKAVVR